MCLTECCHGDQPGELTIENKVTSRGTIGYAKIFMQRAENSENGVASVLISN